MFMSCLLILLSLCIISNSFIRHCSLRPSSSLHASRKYSNSIQPVTNPDDVPIDRKMAKNRLRGLSITGSAKVKTKAFSLNGMKNLEFVDSYMDVNKIPLSILPEIAILGRSNVGKSSLLNMLASSEKNVAVVGRMPGRTRCVNLFTCKENKKPFCMLADLPGYGFARMSNTLRQNVTTAAVGYLHGRTVLKGALVLVDCRRGYQESDTGVLQTLTSLGIPFTMIVTKVDLLSSHEFMKVQRDIQDGIGDDNNFRVVMCSSATGLGRKEVWAAIQNLIMMDTTSQNNQMPLVEGPIFVQDVGTPIHSVEWYPGD